MPKIASSQVQCANSGQTDTIHTYSYPYSPGSGDTKYRGTRLLLARNAPELVPFETMVRLIEVVGSLNIDLVSTTPRVPGPGETLQASSFSTGFGGKGANQAVACVRMLDDHVRSSGNAVRMVGAVGKDQFGDDFISQLKSEGISPAAVRSVDGLTTGSTIIIVEQSTGENRILFTPAANFSLKPNFVDAQPGLQPGHGLVVFQLEIPFDTVLAGLRTAKQLGKETVFNPAPAKPLPGATYKVIDHLIVNESEASILSGTSEGNLAASLDHVAQSFINKGVTTVVITLGSKVCLQIQFNVDLIFCVLIAHLFIFYREFTGYLMCKFRPTKLAVLWVLAR